VAIARIQRARRGSGSITPRGHRFFARVDLGLDADGRRIRRNRTFSTKSEAQAWIEQQHSHSEELILPVADQRLDEYLRWWLEHEAPKGKPGRAPLATTTLQGYRINVERHLIPALGHKRVGQLRISDLDAFASRKLTAGYAPSTVNRIRETLRSALSTALRQDRLTRNVARYGGGVAAARPSADRFTDPASPSTPSPRSSESSPAATLTRSSSIRSSRSSSPPDDRIRIRHISDDINKALPYTKGAPAGQRGRRNPPAGDHQARRDRRPGAGPSGS
jgi:hypothetical protein